MKQDDSVINIQLTQKSYNKWEKAYKQIVEYYKDKEDEDSAFLVGKLHSIFEFWSLLILLKPCEKDKTTLRLMLATQLGVTFKALKAYKEGKLEEMLQGLFHVA